LTRMFSVATNAHLQAMYRVMAYCLATPNRGRLMKPTRKCSEENLKNFEFRIRGRPDSDHAKDPETRRSVTGYTVFLEDCPTATKSKMQSIVATSSTEAEYIAAAECAQEMLFQMRVLESLGLKVEKPMVMEIDNKGAIDLGNNWSAAGRTRHIDVRHHLLRELKESNVLRYEWLSTDEMSSDIFNKNVAGAVFKRHVKVYCGEDEYGNAVVTE